MSTQFNDESIFLNFALQAKVEYIVRISITTSSVGPATYIAYGRHHWAIETMLEQPEFKEMKWTSLQPAVFWPYAMGDMVDWVKDYKKNGEIRTFSTMFSGDGSVAPIEGKEVGIIASHLLSLEDPSSHSGKKYILQGPSDFNGKDQVALIEKYAGTKIDEVKFEDKEFMCRVLEAYNFPKNSVASIRNSKSIGLTGETSLAYLSTSPEVLKLYTPKVRELSY